MGSIGLLKLQWSSNGDRQWRGPIRQGEARPNPVLRGGGAGRGWGGARARNRRTTVGVGRNRRWSKSAWLDPRRKKRGASAREGRRRWHGSSVEDKSEDDTAWHGEGSTQGADQQALATSRMAMGVGQKQVKIFTLFDPHLTRF